MTFTYNGAISFVSTTTGNLVTTAGKTITSMNFNGAAGSWQFQDNSTIATLTLTKGTLDLNGKTFTVGTKVDSSTTGGTRVLTMGAATVNCSGSGTAWNMAATNLTINANTSTINFTNGASTIFNGGAQTYNNVVMNTFNSVSTMNDANTFANLTIAPGSGIDAVMQLSANQTVTGTLTLTGNSISSRLFLKSTTLGTAQTITTTTTNTITNTDFRDITGAGAASWNLGSVSGRSGDCGGNSGITFSTPATYYWFKDTGNWSNTALWFTATNGGGSSGVFPLAQDTSIFDANSISTTVKTVTMDVPRYGAIDATNIAHTATFTHSATALHYGSLTMPNAATLTSGGSAVSFNNRTGTAILTLGSTRQLWGSLTIDNIGGTVQLGAALSMRSSTVFTLTSGTFDANNFDISGISYVFNGTGTSALLMGTGTWTSSGTGTVWNNTASGLTTTPSTSKILISDTSATTKTVALGASTYNNLEISGAASNAIVTLSGAATLGTFKLNPDSSIKLTSGTTLTVTALNWTGTSGHQIIIAATSAGTQATISSPSGTNSCDYLSISDNAAIGGAAFYFGLNTTLGTNVTGWSPASGYPFVKGVGAAVAGTAGITITVPSTRATGDLILIFAESENEDIATPTNFIDLSSSPQGTGAGGGTTSVRLEIFYKVSNGTETTVAIADSGNHTQAFAMVIGGIAASGFINDTSGTTASSSTSVSFPSVTTTQNTCLILNAVAGSQDTATPQASAWANASLFNVVEQADNYTTSAGGGGISVGSGWQTTSGATGATTATLANASLQGLITLALTSIAPIPSAFNAFLFAGD